MNEIRAESLLFGKGTERYHCHPHCHPEAAGAAAPNCGCLLKSSSAAEDAEGPPASLPGRGGVVAPCKLAGGPLRLRSGQAFGVLCPCRGAAPIRMTGSCLYYRSHMKRTITLLLL